MNVIVSHDIDHLRATEHLVDLIIPKAIARNSIELSKGYVTMHEYLRRLGDIFVQNKWENIHELMDFNQENGVNATFFIGVNQGLGLSYTVKNAIPWMKKIRERGFELGVHGICYERKQGIQEEFQLFEKSAASSEFGIRMHYLRRSKETLNHLCEVGYLYDSTEYDLKDPYKVGNMWEFPLHIMDGYMICNGKKWQSLTLEQVKENTLRRIDDVSKMGLEFLTILFHDRYFTDSYNTWKEWYTWLINWLTDQNAKFVNHQQAIKILEKK